MQLHHSKHHQTYVNNYNVAQEKLADAVSKDDAGSIIGLHGALKFNGGGHINHSIFWQNLCPEKDSGEPSGPPDRSHQQRLWFPTGHAREADGLDGGRPGLWLGMARIQQGLWQTGHCSMRQPGPPGGHYRPCSTFWYRRVGARLLPPV